MKYTPTQQRILDLLSDGLSHTKKELHGCLWDEQSDVNAVVFQISELRQLLRPKGQDIICQKLNGIWAYRHVRLVPISAE